MNLGDTLLDALWSVVATVSLDCAGGLCASCTVRAGAVKIPLQKAPAAILDLRVALKARSFCALDLTC